MKEDVSNWKTELQPLLNPASIAVVGISGGPKMGMGANTVKNLLDFGYKGKIYPVNPKYDQIFGLKSYKQLSEIPGELDAMLVAIPAAGVIPLLEQATQKGVKAATVFTSGFAESGPEGKELQQQMVQICEANQIRLCGPNNMGILSFKEKMMLYSATVPKDMAAGGFAFVGQSGSITMCALSAANTRGIGCSYLVTSGNEAVLEAADYIYYLLQDPQTKVVGCYIESFKDPKKIRRAADLALKMGKPIIVLKVGRSQKGQKAALSHTDSLTGADAVQDAFFKQKGIIRVDTIEELVETGELFIKTRLPKRNRIAFTMISGGGCGIVSDICHQYDLNIPDLSEETKAALKPVVPAFGKVDNPLDLTGVAYRNPEIYYQCIEALLKEDVDIICMDPDIPWIEPLFEKAKEFTARTEKLLCVLSLCGENMTAAKSKILKESAIPILQDPIRGLKAIRSLLKFSEFVQAKESTGQRAQQAHAGKERVAGFLAGSSQRMTEFESKKLISIYDIPVTQEDLARSADGAVAIADEIGYPVALKIQAEAISHKTDMGGVVLNIRNEAELRAAYDQMLGRGATAAPDAIMDGVLVQEMIADGIELILGISQDKQFGPYIMCGLGGIYVEALGDVSRRLAPVDELDAVSMLKELRSYRILKGFRGRPAINVQALVKCIVNLSQLASDFRDRIAEIDINPLIVHPEKQLIKAADALVVLK